MARQNGLRHRGMKAMTLWQVAQQHFAYESCVCNSLVPLSSLQGLIALLLAADAVSSAVAKLGYQALHSRVRKSTPMWSLLYNNQIFEILNGYEG